MNNPSIDDLDPRVAYYAGRLIGFMDAAKASLPDDDYAELVFTTLRDFTVLNDELQLLGED